MDRWNDAEWIAADWRFITGAFVLAILPLAAMFAFLLW